MADQESPTVPAGVDSPSRRRLGLGTQLYAQGFSVAEDLPDGPDAAPAPPAPAAPTQRPPSGRHRQETLLEGQVHREAVALPEVPQELIQDVAPPRASVVVRAPAAVRPGDLDTVVTRLSGQTEPAGRALGPRDRPTAMDLPQLRASPWPVIVGGAAAVLVLSAAGLWWYARPVGQPAAAAATPGALARVPAPVPARVPARDRAQVPAPAPAPAPVPVPARAPAPAPAQDPAPVPAPASSAKACSGKTLIVRGTSADPVAPWLAVRASPHADGALLGKLVDGRTVVELGRRGAWIQVRACGAADELRGWVYRDWLAPAAPSRMGP